MAQIFQSISFEKVFLKNEGREVLQDCTFDFPLNQVCRLVFSNDQEKYFFYQAMSHLEGFEKGVYKINQDNVLEFCFEEFMNYRLAIGFGFSTRGLIHNQTLRQNLELPLKYHNIFSEKEREQWLDHSYGYFDLKKDLDKRPSDVSPSAQKAALLLRAFIHKPELVFLDTPEVLLSKKLQANLLQLIDDHRKQFNLKHLFFSTFDEDLSDCLTETNIILKKKSLRLVGRESRTKEAA